MRLAAAFAILAALHGSVRTSILTWLRMGRSPVDDVAGHGSMDFAVARLFV